MKYPIPPKNPNTPRPMPAIAIHVPRRRVRPIRAKAAKPSSTEGSPARKIAGKTTAVIPKMSETTAMALVPGEFVAA
jgi:hypothetical protein